MKDKINIRVADTNDSGIIVNLLSELGYANSKEKMYERINLLSSSKIDAIYLAEIDGNVVGMVSFHAWPRFYEWGNIGRISSLVVQKEYRRKGIARRLIDEVEVFARSINCARIEVTSRSNREDAHEFYQSCGYSLVKSKRFMKACLENDIL